MELLKVFEKESGFILKTIDYQAIDYDKQIPPKDDFKIIEICSNYFIYEVSRVIAFTYDFELSITVRVQKYVKNSQKQKVDLTKNLTEKFIFDNLDFFTSQVMPGISYLVSQITSSFGSQPLVTIPAFIDKDFYNDN